MVSKLLSDQRDDYARDVKADLAKIRERRLAARSAKARLPLERAREKAWSCDWDQYSATGSGASGLTELKPDLTELIDLYRLDAILLHLGAQG